MNILVSNLDLAFSDQDLLSLFTPFGDVASATIAMDSFTDKPRGFGHVDMPNEEQAKSAIEALNGSDVKGKKISVSETEPQHIRRGSYKVGDGSTSVYKFRK